jgi:SagB-type dehydrogenase family enzyme
MIESTPRQHSSVGGTVAGRLRLSAVGGITLRVDDDRLVIESLMGTMTLGATSPGLSEVVAALTAGTSSTDELAEAVLRCDGPPGLTAFYLLIQRLTSLGALQRTAIDAAGALATIRPIGIDSRFVHHPVQWDEPVTLSRFALLRRDGTDWLLESPLGHAVVVIHDRRVTSLVGELARPNRPRDLVDGIVDLDADAVAALLLLLRNADTLTAAPDGRPVEDTDPAAALWSVHDLHFHARSRFGRHSGPFGATFRHIGTIEPLPAVRPQPDGRRIELPRLELEAVAERDPPLTRVIEDRRSIYPAGTAPITLAQLGEFLYRVARVRSQDETTAMAADGRVGAMEVTSRPYPAGGRTYELEVYLSVDRCVGLTSGLYHYDPVGHRLVRLRDRDRTVEGLLQYASIAAPGSAPAVLIHLAARFGRVSWKYDAIAYATILKHVGVMLQTMYLVATAMRLAACALGSGNADLFAEAAGTDYLAETSVGEFMLGARPESAADSTGATTVQAS